MCNTCDNCAHCFIDYSVDYYECTVADRLSEDELVIHFEDNKPGCRLFKTLEDEDYIRGGADYGI